MLVGKLLVLDLLLAGGWSRIMSRWWLLVVGWPARGDSMRWADGAAAEKQQILFGKMRISSVI